jgi:eukaryotic-like serine/threonine-protein kinase
LAVRPDAANAWFGLGLASHDAGRLDDAEAALGECVRLAPTHGWAHAQLGVVLRRLKNPDRAIHHLRLAVLYSSPSALMQTELARALQDRQRWEEAIRCFREAVRLDPDNSWTHYDLGMALNTPGHQDEAIVHLEKAVSLAPGAVEARRNLALALLARDRPADSVEHLRAVLVSEPDNAAVHQALRTALLRLGRLEEARAAWKKALAANLGEHEAWSGYPELCLFLGDKDEFKWARTELLARFRDTTDPYVAERVGRACLLLPGSEEELRQAVALTRRAAAVADVKYDWARPYFLFAQGLANYRRGRFDEAIAVLSGQARDTRYIGPSARLVAAMALYRKGKTDEARAALTAAVEPYDWGAAKADRRDVWIPHVLRREAEALILPSLPAFLEGKHQPRDNGERLALAGACRYRGRRAAEAGLLEAAFAADPKLADDPKAGLRYRAAGAAAVAGCGGGADGAALGEPERARWRRQAVAWLRLDLAAWTKRLEAAQPADRAEVQKVLARWRDDPDLAGLRNADALERLPPAERKECQALWQEVAALLRRAETTR